jgi:hypothetical protein
MIGSLGEIDSRTLDRYRSDPAAFIECLTSPYDGQPYRLIPAERAFIQHALTLDADGRLLYPLLLYSAIKKSRKTEFSALFTLTLIILFGGRFAEGYVLANDEEQATARCFESCRRIIEASPLLRSIAECRADRILFPATQSSIRVLAGDYAGAAGGHPAISVFSELWAFASQRSARLFDELIPVPSRKISCRLIETHAGFSGEGTLLHELYQRGMKLPQVGTDLRAGDGMLMFWSHRPLHHWQDDRWLAQMRRELRPNQYTRMIENEFVSAESSFITSDLWDQCVDPARGHKIADRMLATWAAVDASTKHDSTALALVSWSQPYQRVELCDHKIFTPQPGAPIDFTLDIERTILDWQQRFDLREVWYDPHQMAASAQRLARKGVVMVEYPQSIERLTAMGENLFSLIKGRNLLVYPDEQVRTAVLRAVAQEGNRGWKIDKLRQRDHIDIVVSLGMAALAAVRGQSVPGYDKFYTGFRSDAAAPTTSTADDNLRSLYRNLERFSRYGGGMIGGW